MNSIGERISELIVTLRMTNRSFAGKIGESQVKISAYRRGKYSPGTDTLISIIKNHENLNARWLLLGEGEMFEENKIIDGIDQQKTKIILLLTNMLAMNHDLLEHISQLMGTEKELLIAAMNEGPKKTMKVSNKLNNG